MNLAKILRRISNHIQNSADSFQLPGMAPEGISGMLSYSQSQRTKKLQETRVRSKYGDRAFSHVAPKLWNLLPDDISEEDDIVEFKKKVEIVSVYPR